MGCHRAILDPKTGLGMRRLPPVAVLLFRWAVRWLPGPWRSSPCSPGRQARDDRACRATLPLPPSAALAASDRAGRGTLGPAFGWMRQVGTWKWSCCPSTIRLSAAAFLAAPDSPAGSCDDEMGIRRSGRRSRRRARPRDAALRTWQQGTQPAVSCARRHCPSLSGVFCPSW